jgi:hypothetical protein
MLCVASSASVAVFFTKPISFLSFCVLVDFFCSFGCIVFPLTSVPCFFSAAFLKGLEASIRLLAMHLFLKVIVQDDQNSLCI